MDLLNPLGRAKALLDLRGRVADIVFSFSGGTPPAPGTNTDTFGICSTTGGIYTAGDVVYDSGSALFVMSEQVAAHLTTRTDISGDISMLADALYSRRGSEWVLIGASTPVDQDVLVDDIDLASFYVGRAVMGSLTSDSVWQIKKVVEVAEVVSFIYADGSTDYDKTWDDRGTYAY